MRQQHEIVDATLLKEPVYGQVPAFAGGGRGVLDLLAIDRPGRLTVLELKASADLHLPMQALDYWLGVSGIWIAVCLRQRLLSQASPCGPIPRVLLVSPSLEFHPSTERFWPITRPSSKWNEWASG